MISRCAVAHIALAVAYPKAVAGQIKTVITRLRVFWVGYCLTSITLVLAGSASALAETQQPVHWTLSASCHDCSRIRNGGGTAVARLRATMKPGWHVYALDQGPGGPVPMRISLPQHVFVMDGDIDSPTPKTALDPNFGIEVRFYEDDASFTFHLKNGPQTLSEPLKIFVDVMYQACSQQMCMPPKVAHLATVVSR